MCWVISGCQWSTHFKSYLLLQPAWMRHTGKHRQPWGKLQVAVFDKMLFSCFHLLFLHIFRSTTFHAPPSLFLPITVTASFFPCLTFPVPHLAKWRPTSLHYSSPTFPLGPCWKIRTDGGLMLLWCNKFSSENINLLVTIEIPTVAMIQPLLRVHYSYI